MEEKEIVRVILREHGFGTKHLTTFREQVKAYRDGPLSVINDMVWTLREYEDLYRIHVAREDSIFFDKLAKQIQEELQEELIKKMKEVEAKTIGLNNREKYYDIVRELKKNFLRIDI